MKKWYGKILVSCWQECEVEANSEKQAKMLMAESFDISMAEPGEIEIWDCEEITEGEKKIELDYMRAQLRYALNNLDSISKRDDVKTKIENVYFAIDELCEQNKEENQ